MVKREKRRIIALLADTHGGSRLALCNPDVVLYEEDAGGGLVEYTPRLTPIQEYLWSLYKGDIQEVMRLAGKDPIYVLHVGDLTQGFRHRNQLISQRRDDQPLVAASNLLPWSSKPCMNSWPMTEPMPP